MIDGDIRAALDDCLEAMARGASIDEALARHNGLRPELRPLLEQAALLRSLARVPAPPPMRQQAGRTRYLMRAAELRRQREPKGAFRRALRWLRGDASPRARVLQGAVASFVIFAMMAGGVVALSTGASPDSRLYSVKLATESARMKLTRSDDARAELALAHIETRQRELRDVLAKGAAPNDRLLGRLAKNTEDAVAYSARSGRRDLLARAGDLLDEQMRMMVAAGPRLDAGSSAKLARLLDAALGQRDFVARLLNQGSGVEVRVMSGGSAEQVKLGTARRIESSDVQVEEKAGKTLVRVGGQTYEVATGVRITPGDVARLVVAEGRDGVSYVIAASPAGSAAARTTRVEGRVTEATSADLRVGNNRILIDDSTIVLNGTLSPGRMVSVEGVSDGNGNIRATQIQVLPDDTPAMVRGVVTGREGRSWTVDGKTFIEVGGTVIDLQALDPGASPVGATVQVEATYDGGGTGAIRRLVVLPPTTASVPATPTASATPAAPASPSASATPSATPAATAIAGAPAASVWRVESTVAALDDGVLTLRDGARARIGPDTQTLGRLEVGARVAVELRHVKGDVPSAISIQVLNVTKQQGEDEEPAPPPPGPLPVASPAPQPASTATTVGPAAAPQN